jgi:small subunit ribosomal protein S17
MARPRKKTDEETQEQVEETPVEEPEAEATPAAEDEAPAEEPAAEAAPEEAPEEEEPAEEPAPEPVAEEEPVAEAEEPPAEEPAAEAEAEPEAAADEAPAEEPASEEPAAEASAAPVAEPKKKRKRVPRSERRTRSKRVREKPGGERKPITRLPKPEQPRGNRKERRGIVVSAAMDKTIVVRVDTVKPHPVYKKIVRRSTKLHAHDEANVAKLGDVVRVIESRPLSKTKSWRLVEVLEEAK